MGFTFVHAADLHLDTPFIGLSHLPVRLREQIQESTFTAFQHLIQLCIEEQADFLVLSGDIYNSADRSLRSQLRFRDGLENLASHGISSYIIHGNHDPLDGYRARLHWPEGVHVFEGREVESVPFKKDGQEVARLYGVSYSTNHVKDNLAAKFHRGLHESFAIGLLHTNVGEMTEHGNYAPCTIRDLQRSGMDYWALGHIHARSVLKQGNPTIVYPGNTQGRSFKETGEKGCYLVRVEGGIPTLTFQPLDAVRWFDLAVDARDCHTEQELLVLLDEQLNECVRHAAGRSVITRIGLRASESLSFILKQQGTIDDLLSRYRELSDPFIWTQSITVRYSNSLRMDDPFLIEMYRWVDQLKQDPQLLSELLEEASTPLVYEHRLGSKWLAQAFDDIE